MEKSRYVVEYLAEGGSDVESLFLEANSEAEAKDFVLTKCGTFSTILSCQLTKSCGGSGATATSTEVQPGEVTVVTDEVAVVVPRVTKEKPVKPHKESLASKTRALLAANSKLTYGEKVTLIAKELDFTEQKAKGYVTFYSKQL